MAGLHFIDGFDEIEESFSTFGFVRDAVSGMVGGIKNSVIAEVFKDTAIDVELFFGIKINSVEEWDEIAKSGFLDFFSGESVRR